MVASLQSKKEVLETKLKDKTSELRKLCLEEAELTGVLPPETPLEPGESPPQFRRRIATAFTFPENLINKLKSKEDETLAALELECKIQTGIAEAALGLANDGTASKSVRRKHRVLYEETQNRLHELQNRLSSLKQQSQPKLKKKPRPQTEIDDCIDRDDGEEAGESLSHPGLLSSLPERGSHTPMRHSQTYCGYSKLDHHLMPYHQRMVHSHMTLPGIDHRHSMLVSEMNHTMRSNNPSPIENAAWWPKGREMWHHQMNNIHFNRASPDHFYIEAGHNYDRFGSLDRNSQSMMIDMTDSRLSSTLPRNIVGVVGQANSSVLLPGQTYPENSLMRTQSLGSVESSNKPLVIPLDRYATPKSREKEWYESSLDSSPMVSTGGKSGLVASKSDTASLKSDEIVKTSATSAVYDHDNESTKTNQASINNIQFDTVVPYESPKNHTVVQAGKWQPYREVTKPFEMSDFYKYSTKFRQFKIQVQAEPKVNEQPTVQQKAIYKPLQPLECRPLMTNCENRSNKNILQSSCVLPYNNTYSTWYHETNVQSKPRPSTLV